MREGWFWLFAIIIVVAIVGIVTLNYLPTIIECVENGDTVVQGMFGPVCVSAPE